MEIQGTGSAPAVVYQPPPVQQNPPPPPADPSLAQAQPADPAAAGQAVDTRA